MKLEPNDPFEKNRKRAAYKSLELIYNNVLKNEKKNDQLILIPTL